jgi:hypothetical protein
MEASRVPRLTPGAPPPPQSQSAPRTTVTISSLQRDALYALLMAGFGELSDLERATMTDDLETCYRLGRRVTDALRLIVDGGLGWGETTGQESATLALPPDDLRRILNEIRRGAVHFQKGVQPEYEEKRDEWELGALALSACTEALEQLEAVTRPDEAGGE